jgi:hypothetical protein
MEGEHSGPNRGLELASGYRHRRRSR